MDLLLPRTDGGVAIQIAIGMVVLGTALVLVRRDRDLRLAVVGVAVMAAAWFGLRAVH